MNIQGHYVYYTHYIYGGKVWGDKETYRNNFILKFYQKKKDILCVVYPIQLFFVRIILYFFIIII